MKPSTVINSRRAAGNANSFQLILSYFDELYESGVIPGPKLKPDEVPAPSSAGAYDVNDMGPGGSESASPPAPPAARAAYSGGGHGGGGGVIDASPNSRVAKLEAWAASRGAAGAPSAKRFLDELDHTNPTLVAARSAISKIGLGSGASPAYAIETLAAGRAELMAKVDAMRKLRAWARDYANGPCAPAQTILDELDFSSPSSPIVKRLTAANVYSFVRKRLNEVCYVDTSKTAVTVTPRLLSQVASDLVDHFISGRGFDENNRLEEMP